jgi:membrane associated rhomboid family serine protease
MAGARTPTFQFAANRSTSFVAALTLIEAADQVLQLMQVGTLDALGIRPRTREGLVGILFSPLLHGNWFHLAANAIPLLVLLTLLYWDRHYRPGSALTSIWLVSGLGTWLIGRPDSIHVGASSIIYGLVSYLIVAGLMIRSWRSVVIAIGVGLAFSGIWYGVLPQAGPISWEGHLSGAVAGAIAARWTQR